MILLNLTNFAINMNYTTESGESYNFNIPARISHQLNYDNVGTFVFDHFTKYRDNPEFVSSIVAREVQSVPLYEISPNATKVQDGLKRLLDTISNSKDSRVKKFQINYQGIIERSRENLFKNPYDKYEIDILKRNLYSLIGVSQNVLSQAQINSLFELLTDLNKLNNPISR